MCSTSWIKQLNSLNTKCTIIKPQVDINKRIPTNNNNSVNVNSSTLVNPISGTLLYINRQIDNLKWYIATILFNQIFILYKLILVCVGRTQYCLLTLYWQKLHPSSQEVGTARGMRGPIDLRPGTGKTFLCLHPSTNFLYIVLATQKL